MQKTRTRQWLRRTLRQSAAVFLLTAAVWLGGLTGFPRSIAALLPQREQAAASQSLSLLHRIALWELGLPGLSPSPPESSPALITPPPLPTPSDEEPEPQSTTAPGDIIGKTMVAGSSAKYITSGNISIYNHTEYSLDIPKLLSASPKLTKKQDGPQVLIFHSHATEAYTMDGTDLYTESDSYRTLDTERNIVRVGSEIAAILEAAGIEVIHDTTLYDYPNYNDAYIRSSAGVDEWLKQYPSLQLVIDLHRDALAAADGTIYKTVAGTVPDCAQVMMVMGTDAMGQLHPNWRVNLSLAVKIQQAVTDKWSTLARPIVLRTSRFNQHQSTGEILVEIGTHGNTLQEAITAGRLFARTLAELFE